MRFWWQLRMTYQAVEVVGRLTSKLRACPRPSVLVVDEVLATAILDRLLHHGDVISINGNSYRLKNRLPGRRPGTDVA